MKKILFGILLVALIGCDKSDDPQSSKACAIQSAKQTQGSSVIDYTFSYNSDGKPVKMIEVIHSTNKQTEYTATYSGDQLTKLEYSSGRKEFSYVNNVISEIKFYSGSTPSGRNSITYNSKSQIVKIETFNSSGSLISYSTFEYSGDAKNPSTIKIFGPNNSNPATTQTLEYTSDPNVFFALHRKMFGLIDEFSSENELSKLTQVGTVSGTTTTIFENHSGKIITTTGSQVITIEYTCN